MSGPDAKQFDEDYRKKDNLSCKAKLSRAGKELPKITDRILKSSFKEFEEKGFLDDLQQLVKESTNEIAAAEAICNALSQEIQTFSISVMRSVEVFREKRQELMTQIEEKEKKQKQDDETRGDSTTKTRKRKGIGLEDLYLQLNKVQMALEGVDRKDQDSEDHRRVNMILENAKEADREKKKNQIETKVKSKVKAIEKVVANLQKDYQRAENAADECKRLCEKIKPDTPENQRMVEELTVKIRETEDIKARVEEVTKMLEEVGDELKSQTISGDESSAENVDGTLTRLEERKQEATVVSDRLKMLMETNEDMVAMGKEYIENATQIEDVDAILVETTKLVEDSNSDFTRMSEEVARFQEEFKQMVKGNLSELRAARSLNGQTPEEYAIDIGKQVDVKKDKCKICLDEIKELSKKVEESSSQLKIVTKEPNSKDKIPKIANRIKRQNKEMGKARENFGKQVEEINNLVQDSTSDVQRKCTIGKGALSIDKLKKDVKAVETSTDQLKQIAERMDNFFEDIKYDEENSKEMIDEYRIAAKEVQTAIEGALEQISQSEEVIRNFTSLLQTDEVEDEEFVEQMEVVKKTGDDIADMSKMIDTEKVKRRRWTNEAETRFKSQRRSKINDSITEFLKRVETSMDEYSRVEEETTTAVERAETAAKNCCRDTNEARKAIQHVTENTDRVKKSLQTGKTNYDKTQALTAKLQAEAKKDEPSIDEISEVKETIDKNVEHLTKTAETVKGAVGKLNASVEEMELKNPTNWDIFKFYHGGEEVDDELLCVIRSPPGILDDVSIQCNIADDLLHSALGPHDRVFSPVIKIEPQDKLFAKFVLVGIPYSKYDPQRKRDRSIMVKNTVDGSKWHVAHTNSTDRSINQFKGLVFAELATKQLSTYVVISRVVEDNATIDKKGETITSSVEQRVCLEYLSGTMKSAVDVALKVQLVEQASFNQLKERHRVQVADLESSSPIINVTYSPIPTLGKPVTMAVPLPNASKAPPMPNTLPVPGHGKRQSEDQGQGGAIHVMVKNTEEKWQELALKDDDIIINKNDVVTFDVTQPYPKLLVLKSSGNERSSKTEMAREVEEWTETVSVVNFVFHHHDEDRTNVIAQIVPQNGCQQLVDDLSKSGYNGPPEPSNEFELREEQEVSIRFKNNGNVEFCEGVEKRLKFYRGRSNKVQFWIKEKDPYRNKGDFNKGVVEIHAKAVRQATKYDTTIEEKFELQESLPVMIPKKEIKHMTRERTFCETDYKGTLSDAGLRDLAQHIGLEFRKLASHLGIKHARMQRIMKDHAGNTEDQIFEMLVTWRQSQPRSADKLKLLKKALTKAERVDLAEKIESS
ncbi:uncharacterized protein [Ptychodera flava]|uniref:uncharacterized protein n=1 Tax=Ptychodera flava TaxID=63121 RepID=UPI00396A2EE2